MFGLQMLRLNPESLRYVLFKFYLACHACCNQLGILGLGLGKIVAAAKQDIEHLELRAMLHYVTALRHLKKSPLHHSCQHSCTKPLLQVVHVSIGRSQAADAVRELSADVHCQHQTL